MIRYSQHLSITTQKVILSMTYYDALTNLFNRPQFERFLQQDLAQAQKKAVSHCVLYLDLDKFSDINQHYGYMAGDHLLKKIAQLLQGQVGQNDVLARLGADEFGILLRYCPLSQAKVVASDIHHLIKNLSFVWKSQVFYLSISIGLVLLNQSQHNSQQVMQQAHRACRLAKQQGEYQTHCFIPLNTPLL
jgi:Amt family ammonium transporter